MTWPTGYKIVVHSRNLTIAQLMELAATFKEAGPRKHPRWYAEQWKNAVDDQGRVGTPIVTDMEPPADYTGCVLSPELGAGKATCIELRQNGKIIEALTGKDLTEEHAQIVLPAGTAGRWV